MNTKRGTPKTMNEAIVNGLQDSAYVDVNKRAEIIAVHVNDFIRQKFAVSVLKAQMMDQEYASKMMFQLLERIEK